MRDLIIVRVRNLLNQEKDNMRIKEIIQLGVEDL